VARLVRNEANDESASAGSEGGARRVSGFLKALDGDAAAEQAETPAASSQAGAEQKDAAGDDKPRKSRLLDRITGVGKSSA
jgi:hypothetical protein